MQQYVEENMDLILAGKFPRLLIILVLFFASLIETNGQRSFGGIPESFNLGTKYTPPSIEMPAFPADSLLRIDSIESLSGSKSYRFAKTFEVNYSPENSGEWVVSEKGIPIWRLSLYSKGAYSIGVSLKDFAPVPGSRIYIYNPDHSEVMGAFTSENITPGGYLVTYPIPADKVIIEYDLPPGTNKSGGFSIAIVAHDYKNAFGKNSASGLNTNLSGSCNVDVNCPTGSNWQTDKRAVCKLLINQSILCSGTLVNNARKDGRAFLLTANHCIPTTNAAYNSLAIFDYEKVTCGGSIIATHPGISGMWLRATTSLIDFSLVELGEKPPLSYNAYYAGWSIAETGITNETSIHHPQGDVKKISFSNTPVVTVDYGGGYEYKSHWSVHWNAGVTEGGSSGCPLFNQDHLIVGTLTGGISSCTYPDSTDFYQKISRAWADLSLPSKQLKYWLDPDNTGITNLAGMNPYNYSLNNCTTHSNIGITETPVNPFVQVIGGYYAGTDTLGITMYAERFISPDSLKITSLNLNVAQSSSPSLAAYITVKIWKGRDKPDSLLYSQQVLYKTLTTNTKNSISLDKIVEVKDTFFVGYELNLPAGNTFAAFIAPDRFAAVQNSAYAYRRSNWFSFPNIPEYVNLSTSIDLGIQSCDVVSGIGRVKLSAENYLIYPNPGTDLFTIKSNSEERINSIIVFSLEGRIIKQIAVQKGNTEISVDLSDANAGIYIVKAFSEKGIWTSRLIKL